MTRIGDTVLVSFPCMKTTSDLHNAPLAGRTERPAIVMGVEGGSEYPRIEAWVFLRPHEIPFALGPHGIRLAILQPSDPRPVIASIPHYGDIVDHDGPNIWWIDRSA